MTDAEVSIDAPTALMVALLAALSLAFLYPGAAFPYHGLLVSTVLLLGAVAAALLLARSGRGLLMARSKPALVALAGVMLLPCWFALRLEAAPVPALGRETVALAMVFALSFVVAMAATSLAAKQPTALARDPLSIAVLWLGAVLGGIALFAIYQVIGTDSMPRSYAWLERALTAELALDDPQREGLLHALRERRAAGTFGAPNIFASFCVAGAMLCAAAAFVRKGNMARIALAALGAACVVATVLSGSRGGLLSLAVACGLFALLAGSLWMTSAMRRRLLAALAISALLASVALVILLAGMGEDSRWGNVSGLKQRVFYWRSGMAMWEESPLAGRGPGAFAALYPQFRLAGSNETIRPHSTIVYLAVSGGLVALLLALAAAGGALWAGLGVVLSSRERGDSSRSLTACGVVAAISGVLVHSLVEYTIEFREATLLLGSLFGILAGTGDAEAWGPEGESPTAAKDTRALLLALIPALIGLAVLWRCEVLPLQAAAAKERALAIHEQSGPSEAAMREIDVALRSTPDSPDLFDLRAWFREGRGDRAGAEADLRQAIALNPYSARLRERLALLLESAGRRDEAVAMQREAIALHPLDPEHWMTLAEMLANKGMAGEARAALRETFGLLLISEREQARRRRIAAALSVELPGAESH